MYQNEGGDFELMENRNTDFNEIKEIVSQIIMLFIDEVFSYADTGPRDKVHLVWDYHGTKILIGLSKDISPYSFALATTIEKEEKEHNQMITLESSFIYLLSFEEKMFCLAHELGHIILTHEGSEEHNRNMIEEFEADLFAASILGKTMVLECIRSLRKLLVLYYEEEERLDELLEREENILKQAPLK